MSNERDDGPELAKALGTTAPQLYKWRKEHKEFGQGSFPGNGNLKQTPEQERIAELEKKLKDAELDRDIQKKQSASFLKMVDDFCFHQKQ